MILVKETIHHGTYYAERHIELPDNYGPAEVQAMMESCSYITQVPDPASHAYDLSTTGSTERGWVRWEVEAADDRVGTEVTSTERMQRGDKITVTVDGRIHEMTVNFIYDDQSIAQANSRTVLAHIRPGGYSVTLRNDNLRKYDVRWWAIRDRKGTCGFHHCGMPVHFEQAEGEAPGVGYWRHDDPKFDYQPSTGRGHAPISVEEG